LLLLLAVLAGAALAALPFSRGLRSPGARLAYLARAGAGILLAALLLDLPLAPARTPGPIVALDASASWARARDDSAFASALAEARRLAGRDTLWLLGDSLRPAPDGALTPRDARSDITPLRDRAAALGRAVVLVTDGALDDPALVAQLPTGSRIEARPGTARPDAALLGFDVPPVVVAGDTLAVTLRVGAGGAGAPAGALRLRLGARDVALVPLPALGPWEQRELREVLLPAAADGAEPPLVAVLTLPGDAEPRNDTLATVLAVAERPSVIVASTAPDQDLRYALAVLRGTLGLPVRAYVRVAPGTWRQDPGFAPATEAQVRTALAAAPIAVLHGDTALFGPPRALARGALALLVPAPEDGAREALLEGSLPGSPLAAALTGVPWDSLPPIALGPAPTGEWTALRARPAGGGTARGVVAGGRQPRPTVVVVGSGFWRWAVREGAPADAHRAFWGAVFAWVGESGADAEPRRDGLRSASLVTAPAEWLPREAAPLPSPAAAVVRPDIGRTLRDPWWPYLAVVLLLCADWVLRRRAGLR
jgi:hypothetical protein